MVASCGVTKKGRVKDVHRTFGGGDVVIKLLVEKTSVNIHLQTWCLSHVVIVRHRYRLCTRFLPDKCCPARMKGGPGRLALQYKEETLLVGNF